MQVEILNIAETNTETKEQLLQFNKFKKEESAVYGILCPSIARLTADDISKLKDIPPRIKEIVEMTKERFYKYEIWEAESSENKDPIILGREATLNDKGEKNYDWYDKIFFLGRWGDELESFEKLKAKATELLIKPIKISLMKIKAQVDFYLSDVGLFVNDSVQKGKIDLPTFRSGCLSEFN